MISVEEARERLLAAAPALPSEMVTLFGAAGRVLSAPLVAERTQPPFSNSSMDGYALRHSDFPGPFTVIGTSRAGERFHGALGAGEAVRIFTGAPLPPGSDTVLIQEDAAVDGNRITPTDTVAAGANVRIEGLDFTEGETLLSAGQRLEPRHIALAGAGGFAELPVARRPRVAFLATGDELVPPGTKAGPDQIVASVTPALAALIERAGAEAIDLGIAPDDREMIAARARQGLDQADILVTLGGASVGDHDLVKPALQSLGIVLDFWKVAVRPGKPLMFASDPLVIGFPGNPVSAMVCAVVFLLPLLRTMQGDRAPGPVAHSGVLAVPVKANGPRRDHMRARQTPQGIAPFPVQDSSMLNVLAQADALLIRPPFAEPAPPGAPCEFYPL